MEKDELNSVCECGGVVKKITILQKDEKWTFGLSKNGIIIMGYYFDGMFFPAQFAACNKVFLTFCSECGKEINREFE